MTTVSRNVERFVLICVNDSISGEFSILSYFHGCVSGIGIAADCKSVALAFLVRVQGHPLSGSKSI